MTRPEDPLGRPYWGDNLARPLVTWSGRPGPDDVESVVEEWLQHKMARRLMDRGLTAERLSQELGGTRSSWQSKLNGHRRLQWTDVIKVSLAFDVALLATLPLPTDDLRQLVPPPFEDWLTHHEADSGRPHFREPSMVDWAGVPLVIDQWVASEAAQGRGWTVTQDVLLNQTLGALSAAGFPSSGGALFGPEAPHSVGIEWPTRDLTVRIVALPADQAKPAAAPLREMLSGTAARLWDLGSNPTGTKALILSASPDFRKTFREALGFTTSHDEYSLIGLSAAHRTGLEVTTEEVDDIHVRVWSGSNIDWFVVK